MLLSRRMSGLSNLFRWRNAAEANCTARLVAAGEIEPALRLILGRAGVRSTTAQAAEFEAFAPGRGIDLSAMHVVSTGRRLIAAALRVSNVAGTSMMMLSTAGASRSTAIACAACAHAGAQALFQNGAALVQVLIEATEAQLDQQLRTRGFSTVATLIYLQRPITPAPAPHWPDNARLLCYSAHTHALFAQTIEQSYINSLDCPALHDRRSIDDVIAGHKAAGEHDPNLWYCVVDAHGNGLGVLLLSIVGAGQGMELIYLGLTPAARGCGLGDALMQHALYVSYALELPSLTLAVDDGNIPAIKLYQRHHLTEIHRRIALMLTAMSASR
jgi:mycothiol synthase